MSHAPTAKSPELAAWPEITFTATDRILVLAPHPDDESLTCGGIIQQALAQGLPVHVAFYTYGDNNEWAFMVYRKRPEFMPHQMRNMGEMRHGEALRAAAVLGLRPENLTFLGYPDFGTLHIWQLHWGDVAPFVSMFTHVTAVPYKTALRPGALYKGDEILADLTRILREFRPTRVFVSHPADHNPDHAALYCFTQVALWNLADELAPQVHPFLTHYPGWPALRYFMPHSPIIPPARLRHVGAWQVALLTENQVQRKLAALQAHASQYRYSQKYLDSFIRANELFGDLPRVRVACGGGGQVALGPAEELPAAEPAEELEERERARFVGVETQTLRMDGDVIELTVSLSRPLGHQVAASAFFFGYRSDRAFAAMPKLHVGIGPFHYTVNDRDTLLDRHTVELRRSAHQIVIRVPLTVLGHPRRVFISNATHMGEVPLSGLPWRILEITDG